MKIIHVGAWPFPTGVIKEQLRWLAELPKMKNGSDAYEYIGGGNSSKVRFKRNEDATAFRLKFNV